MVFKLIERRKENKRKRKKREYKMITAIVEWGEGKESISTGYLFGKVEFTQYSPEAPVKVYLRIEGLPDGIHGFHIHEKPLEDTEGDVMDCCDKLGGHFNVGEKWSPDNPLGTPHGQHNGDLCMNLHFEQGMVQTKFWDDKISLYPGEKCIVGRSLVIHENEDDLGQGIYDDENLENESKMTGNAGGRIACGNIVKLP